VDCPVQFQEREIRDIEIRPAQDLDSIYLARNLRKADRQEVYSAYGWGPLEAVECSRQASRACFVVLYKGDPALIFGVSDILSDPGHGCIWMLGTDAVDKFRKRFVRYSREYLKELCVGYDSVYNYVDERHTESIRWLRSIGANFTHRHPEFGIEKRPFLEFIICAE
jgi:hypothetical protein